MEMMVEACIRGFPETLLLFLAIDLINFQKKKVIKCIIISAFVTLIEYIVKIKIPYGVHTLVGILLLILISHYINKISIINAISSSLIVILLLSLCEWFNLFLIREAFNIYIVDILQNPFYKTLIGLPSLLFFMLLIYLYYLFIKVKKEQMKNVSN